MSPQQAMGEQPSATDDIYSLGRYDEQLDYARLLTPALSDAEADWMRDVLKERLPRSSAKGRKPS